MSGTARPSIPPPSLCALSESAADKRADRGGRKVPRRETADYQESQRKEGLENKVEPKRSKVDGACVGMSGALDSYDRHGSNSPESGNLSRRRTPEQIVSTGQTRRKGKRYAKSSRRERRETTNKAAGTRHRRGYRMRGRPSRPAHKRNWRCLTLRCSAAMSTDV